jgi:hypothetical protein
LLAILWGGSGWRGTYLIAGRGLLRASILLNNEEKESDDGDQNGDQQKDKQQRSTLAHFIPR